MNEMNITSAQYVAKEGENICIRATIDGDVVVVPNNAPGNRHYDEIQRQVAAGTLTIQEAD